MILTKGLRYKERLLSIMVQVEGYLRAIILHTCMYVNVWSRKSVPPVSTIIYLYISKFETLSHPPTSLPSSLPIMSHVSSHTSPSILNYIQHALCTAWPAFHFLPISLPLDHLMSFSSGTKTCFPPTSKEKGFRNSQVLQILLRKKNFPIWILSFGSQMV
jgi:hypothetical protein